MGKPIGLQVPARTNPGKDAFNMRPRAVENWIAALPRASVGRCAQLLFATLQETNGLQCSHVDRVRMLDALREPVQYVTQAMQSRFVGAGFPLPVKNQKIATATREIYSQMATGYKIAIEDLLTHSLILTDKHLLTTLIHRATTYLSRVLLTTFQVYAPLPQNIWSDLHRLYAYGEQHKLHRTAILDTQHQYIKKTTISGEYIRILLLSLASPYNLRQGEVDNVYVNLERWMNLATLLPVDSDKNVGADFLVSLDSDEPPCYVSLASSEYAAETLRMLDTEPVTQALYDELQKSEEIVSKTLLRVNMQKANLSHDLIRRLSVAWGAIPKRAFNRNEIGETVTVAVGLSATHQAILKHNQQFAAENRTVTADDSQLMRVVRSQSHYEAHDVEHAGDKREDTWEMIYDHGHLQLVQPQVTLTTDSSEEATNRHFCITDSWKLINQSAGGFCIQCDTDCGNTVQVGELIGLHANNGPASAPWTIGIVRWMRTHGKFGVKLGGQFLGRTAIPAGIRMVAEADESEQIQRALFLPAVKPMGRPSTLVTFSCHFRIGAVLFIHLNTGTLKVKLAQERDDAGLYSEFEYEVFADEPANDTSEKTVGDAQAEFDDVWDSI